MYPGLSETDCQAALTHYRQLVAEGQRQQTVARVISTSDPVQSGGDAIRRRLARFGNLGQLLRGAVRPWLRTERPVSTVL